MAMDPPNTTSTATLENDNENGNGNTSISPELTEEGNGHPRNINKYPKHPISSITSKIDKALNPPPRPTKEIQAKISKFTKLINLLITGLNTALPIPNTTKEELKSLENIKAREHTGIFLSDKTNRIIVMDKEFVDEETLEHLNTEYFTKMDKDPSEDIEKEAHK